MNPTNLLLACAVVLSSPRLLLACGGCTGLLLWGVRKVVVTPEAPEHLHSQIDIDTHDEK